MILTLHIICAVMSVITSITMVIMPSKSKMIITLILSLGTFATGGGLLMVHGVSLGQVCVSGGLYIVVLMITTILSKSRYYLLQGKL